MGGVAFLLLIKRKQPLFLLPVSLKMEWLAQIRALQAIQIDLVQSSGVLLGRYFKFCPPTQLAWKQWQAFILIVLVPGKH